MSVTPQQIQASKDAASKERHDLSNVRFEAQRRAAQISAHLGAMDSHGEMDKFLSDLLVADAGLSTLRTMLGQVRKQARKVQKRHNQQMNGVFLP